MAAVENSRMHIKSGESPTKISIIKALHQTHLYFTNNITWELMYGYKFRRIEQSYYRTRSEWKFIFFCFYITNERVWSSATKINAILLCPKIEDPSPHTHKFLFSKLVIYLVQTKCLIIIVNSVTVASPSVLYDMFNLYGGIRWDTVYDFQNLPKGK